MAQQILATLEATKSALIVADDVETCLALEGILGARGFEVSSVPEGAQASVRIREGDHSLVLVDTMMPGMHGVETLRHLKSLNPHAAIVIITGHSRIEGFVSDTLWSGVDGVLYKPIDPSAVTELLDRRLSQGIAVPLLDLRSIQPDPAVVRLVPEDMARKYALLPLKIDAGQLLVAMADPANLMAIEDLRASTGLSIKPVAALRSDVERLLSKSYESAHEIEKQIERIAPSSGEVEVQAAQRLSADLVAQTPIARAVQLMVAQAAKDRASDIHIEPQENCLRIRYRIDGVLHEVMTLPLRVHAPMLSRIKVLSSLNIAERRRPQDGQFSLDVTGTSVDIRVATINTVHGEMAVLRVLDKSVSVRGLDELGFLPDTLEEYQRVIHAPWGIILIAGPTGSGKTSTLYASLNQLDRNENKIITIEDPVEYRFDGISQVQVNRQADILFAGGLRAAMRLDPDIILVGEIRDQETASTAVQASLTGHLVFSSIHANDSVGAILRLIDLGVEPFLVTSSLLAVVSQRLARRVCSECAVPTEVAPMEATLFEREAGEVRTVFNVGQGCPACAYTGYRGRVAILEQLIMNDELRRLLLQGGNSSNLQKTAVESGMRPMLQDGMLKAAKGMTTPAEVLKNVFALH